MAELLACLFLASMTAHSSSLMYLMMNRMTKLNQLDIERRPCPLFGTGSAFFQPADVLEGDATSSEGQLASHGGTRLEELEEKLETKVLNVMVLDGAWPHCPSYSLYPCVALH